MLAWKTNVPLRHTVLQQYYPSPRFSIILPLCFQFLICVANSLVAISDEKGDVRLLDTSPSIETGFTKEYIRINCHDNAIFDISWSNDDMKLVSPAEQQLSG